MMDLDSAIQHCEKVAISKTKQVENGDWEKGSSTERDCIACASEHRQLAEWLKELKAYKDARAEINQALYDDARGEQNDYERGRKSGIFLCESIISVKLGESRSEIPNTCGDAISRQEVLNAITMAEVRWQAVDNVNKLPSVTPQQMTLTSSEKPNKWIPVSERLPEKRKKCLVTFRGGYVGIMCYAPDLYGVDEYDFYAKKGKAGWYDYDSEWGYYSRDDVVAWMPLPEPYEAESEEEE